MFGEIARGFLHGVMQGVAQHAQQAQHAQDTVAALCLVNGWSVDERDGDVSLLHFRDPAGFVRKLSVWREQAGGLGFVITSNVRLAAVPPAVADYLLRRNPQLEVGAWATEGNHEGVVIGITHRAHGLTPAGFRRVCELMVNEVADFDGKLKVAGFLT